MGLDMYVVEGKPTYTENEIELVYWRKANHVHKYFADLPSFDNEEQEGEITENDIRHLLDLCELILENHELAPELLPTQSGFFFGGTDYDEYYFYKIEDTVRDCTFLLRLLEQNPDMDLWYYASW